MISLTNNPMRKFVVAVILIATLYSCSTPRLEKVTSTLLRATPEDIPAPPVLRTPSRKSPCDLEQTLRREVQRRLDERDLLES